MEQEIFSIQLNQEGISWLKKFHKLARVLFLLCLLISVAGLFNVLLKFYDINYDPDRIKDPIVRQQIVVSRAYILAFHLFFPVQVYFFYRFSTQNSKGIDLMNTFLFNASFRLLVINAIVSVVTFSINLLYVIVVDYGDWILFKKYN